MTPRDAGGEGPPAEELIPPRPTIAKMAKAAADCPACRLCWDATQTAPWCAT